MPEPAIEVSELRKSYDEVEAVRGLSFRVERGEVLGLLGPNGAGKTTTVEILAGYRDRTGGSVSVLGHDPADASLELRRRVGIVLQSAGFYPRVTVTEARRAAPPAATPRPAPADDVIGLVGLEGSRQATGRPLSGGQQRRLDLALALVGDPSSSSSTSRPPGSTPTRGAARGMMVRRLRALGKTVLLTTHYLDEASSSPTAWR